MREKLLKTFLIAEGIALTLIPSVSYGATKGSLLACIPSDDPITDPNQLTACVNGALDIVRLFGGIGFFAMGLWGGITWATSGGNEDRIKKGRQILTAAFVGLFIVVFAPVLVNTFIDAITGGG